MEDAATCEISRTQIWQWIRHPGGVLDDGRKVTAELFRSVLAEELDKIRADVGPEPFARGKYPLARRDLRPRHHQRRVRRVPDAAGVRVSAVSQLVKHPRPQAWPGDAAERSWNSTDPERDNLKQWRPWLLNRCRDGRRAMLNQWKCMVSPFRRSMMDAY